MLYIGNKFDVCDDILVATNLNEVGHKGHSKFQFEIYNKYTSFK